MIKLVRWVSALCLLQATVAVDSASAAEPIISLKGGETAEIGFVYFVKNCRNLLKDDPTVQVMEGPSDVTVSLRKGDIKPQSGRCTKSVPGGTLVVAAPKEVKTRTEGTLTVRLKLPTTEGERQSTRNYRIKLFP